MQKVGASCGKAGACLFAGSMFEVGLPVVPQARPPTTARCAARSTLARSTSSTTCARTVKTRPSDVRFAASHLPEKSTSPITSCGTPVIHQSGDSHNHSDDMSSYRLFDRRYCNHPLFMSDVNNCNCWYCQLPLQTDDSCGFQTLWS